MPVSIEDVLALLPEMFPGIQQIPLGNIRPNPDNHSKPKEKDIQELVENLTEKNLVNAIKVQPDRDNPLAPGVQLHPDNPRLRGDGKPWMVGDFNYVILSGENRYLAFGRLKRGVIPGYTLNPSPQEANEIMWLDNAVRERDWWASYRAIEMEIKANPNLSIRQVAANLKMDRDKVSRTIRLLPLIGQIIRDFSGGVSAIENKGFFELSEMAVAGLGELAPESANKPGAIQKALSEGQEPPKLYPYPPIPPETQDLFNRALKEAGDQGMTESQVKGLVAHIQQGGKPEEYRPGVKPTKSKTHESPEKTPETTPPDTTKTGELKNPSGQNPQGREPVWLNRKLKKTRVAPPYSGAGWRAYLGSRPSGPRLRPRKN